MLVLVSCSACVCVFFALSLCEFVVCYVCRIPSIGNVCDEFSYINKAWMDEWSKAHVIEGWSLFMLLFLLFLFSLLCFFCCCFLCYDIRSTMFTLCSPIILPSCLRQMIKASLIVCLRYSLHKIYIDRAFLLNTGTKSTVDHTLFMLDVYWHHSRRSFATQKHTYEFRVDS